MRDRMQTKVARRYDRIAKIYDLFEAPMDWLGGSGRRLRVLGWLADKLTYVTRRMFGPAVNRRTEDNVRKAGLEVVDVHRQGVWRELVARRQPSGRRSWPSLP